MKLKFLIRKTYILANLFNCNYLYRIYYVFKRTFKYVLVIKKPKNHNK